LPLFEALASLAPQDEAERHSREAAKVRDSLWTNPSGALTGTLAPTNVLGDPRRFMRSTMATSAAAAAEPQQAKTLIAKDHLKAFVERIERLEEEKKAIADDIRDVYAEAKGNGFDVKALRTIVRMRKQDKDERAEQETILQTYMLALGMI
jgi:uncharacterized protein (UPF0335 family)